MLATDISNYSSPVTAEAIAEWKATGVGRVIIQAFPPYYASKYAEQRDQMRTCAAAGMPFDCYIYDYLGDPTWRDGCLAGLTQAQNEEGLLPHQVWLDEEDTETEGGWSANQRIDAIARSLDAVAGWVADRGVEGNGIYAGAWWWVPKTGNTDRFAYCELWDADYDEQADTEQSWTPYGGWTHRRVKQFRGTSALGGVTGLDLNVLSVEEAAEMDTPPSDNTADELAAAIAARDGLVNSLGYIAGDLLRPVAKQKTSTLALRRLVAGIRAQAEQHGIAHA